MTKKRLLWAIASAIIICGCAAHPDLAKPLVAAADTDKNAAKAKPERVFPGKGAVKKSLDRGCNWLTEQQFADGAYGIEMPDMKVSDVGVTALVVHALAESHRKYRESDGPFMSNAVKYLLKHAQDDGGFYNPGQGLRNYKTSVTILALASLDRGRSAKYAKELEAARTFVADLQCSENSRIPYDKGEHKPAYGGIGYGSDKRPDLSNTQYALEALRAAGLSEDSDVYKRAITFLERCQNRSESNDLFKDKEHSSTDDGGFMYSPGTTKADTVQHPDGSSSYSSYGSMTYAGLKSYIYAGLTREDPRVQAAWDWLQKNYTVEANPGMVHPKNPKRGWQGLFYYYVVMARTLEVLEVDEVVTPDGKKHKWAEELAARLLELQREDGSWINPEDRWWEGSPVLVTGYAIQALSICYRNL